MSTCLKHHGINSPLSLMADDNIEENQSLLEEVFNRINGLERRLQVMYMYIYSFIIIPRPLLLLSLACGRDTVVVVLVS